MGFIVRVLLTAMLLLAYFFNFKGILMFKKFLAPLFSFLALMTTSNAAPVTVDLGDASTSLTNAGTAMVGLAVLVLAFILVLRFLRK